jgi:uncharacterized YigZ family protein
MQTIQQTGSGAYREKGSKFLAYAYAVHSEAEIKTILDELWKDHPKARHVCYAYRLGFKGEKVKMNDDGEPSNTAGAPIFNHIEGNGLSFILIAVVRYFGGTKLGKGGLVNAYGSAAGHALANLNFVELVEYKKAVIRVDYASLGTFMDWLSKQNLLIIERQYEDICNFIVEIPLENWVFVKNQLTHFQNVKLTENKHA